MFVYTTRPTLHCIMLHRLTLYHASTHQNKTFVIHQPGKDMISR